MELYEQLQQRMGVALIGPPNSGKTTIRTLLFHVSYKVAKKASDVTFVLGTEEDRKECKKTRFESESDAPKRAAGLHRFGHSTVD